MNSSAVIDFYDDTQHDLMSKVAFPGEVSRLPIDILTPEDHERLENDQFGLVFITKRAHVIRKFPLHDPGNAYLSAQYFDQTHEKLALPARFIAAKFIKEACIAYDLPATRMVEAYAARVGQGEADDNTFVEGSESRWMLGKFAQYELLTKEAAAVETNALLEMPKEHFALVTQTGDGETIRKYAMPDAAHVKMAEAYFDQYAMDLAPEHRHRFAASVMNRAGELGVELKSGSIEKWASATWNKHFDAHLEMRKSLLPRNPRACAVLDKLASSMHETDPATMADALATFDRTTGLDRYYDRALVDPWQATMGGTEKIASGWSSEVDGHLLTEVDLRKVASGGRLKSYLGESMANQFGKNPVEIFEALPVPEQMLIKQIATGEA